jgi:DNA-binding IclR family transcriptional regulator
VRPNHAASWPPWLIVSTGRRSGLRRAGRTRQQLAEQAGTNPVEVTRALSRLVELGALTRTGHGRYTIHPSVAWHGPLASRETATRKLEPVD